VPTLGEACQILRVSRATLEKWMLKLGIVPSRHEWDLRYFTISAEDVEAIRAARSHMPGAISRPQPRQHVPRAQKVARQPPPSLLPADGLLSASFSSKTEAARWLATHGVSVNTARGWDGWDEVLLEGRSVLLFALTHDTGDFRQRWHLARCGVAGCACEELLPE
jgi:hypothetical protein